MRLRLSILFFFISFLSFSQNQRSETETWELAKSIHQRIANGNTSFNIAATLLSEDPATAPKGGDLGWMKRGTLVAEYERVAWTLPIGKISEPFKTEFGIMIIQVVDRNKEEFWTKYILLKLPEEKK